MARPFTNTQPIAVGGGRAGVFRSAYVQWPSGFAA